MVWQWDNADPFGNNTPNENPSNQGQFTFNLRFPGQYYDRETGLAYNVFRDYDSATGRYVESDPIGLEGGINTYAYVQGNPVLRRDSLGLVDAMGNASGSDSMDNLGMYPGPFLGVVVWDDPDPDYRATIFGTALWDRDTPSNDSKIRCYLQKYWGNYQASDRARGDRATNPALVYDMSLAKASHYLNAYDVGLGYGMKSILYYLAKVTIHFDAHKASRPDLDDVYWSVKGGWDGLMGNPMPAVPDDCSCHKLQ